MTKFRTDVIIERDFNDPTIYRITICPGEDMLKVKLETSLYLMKASRLPYKMKKGAIQKHYYDHITEFLKTLGHSKLTMHIVMILLRKLLLLLHL